MLYAGEPMEELHTTNGPHSEGDLASKRIFVKRRPHYMKCGEDGLVASSE